MTAENARILEGRTAIVTGALGGIGRAVAEHLAGIGCSVVVNALCEASEGERAAREIAEAGRGEAVFEPADLSHVEEIEALAGRALARFGRVDVLVNNAVVRHSAPVHRFATEDWDRSIAVNLSAAFHLTRLFLPGMLETGWGRIINMASIYASRGAANRVDYITTKTALVGLTRAVAMETAAAGITCNAVCPGTMPSPAILDRLEAMAREGGRPLAEVEREYVSARHPTGRFVEMDKVAALIGFLCGPAGDDITGAVLPVDGGWSAA